MAAHSVQTDLGFVIEAEEAAAFVLALRARGLRDTQVLGAMERVPRELFAPSRFADLSRSDVALPLPFGQTMTAPGTVAAMLTALGLAPGQRVLEVGTGSGYVTALLARLGARVVTVERYRALTEAARLRLRDLGLTDAIVMEVGDGLVSRGQQTHFDRILLNGTLATIPTAVTSLLPVGGRLVAAQAAGGVPHLVTLTREEGGALKSVAGAGVRIAPLVHDGATAGSATAR